MKEETLNQILKELFAIDPSLREKEEDLRRMIGKIIASKPDVSIDEQFVTQLRRDLMQKEIKQSFFQQLLTMKNRNYLIGAGSMAVVAVAVLAVVFTRNPQSSSSLPLAIRTVGSEAFGKLGGTNSGGAPLGSAAAMSSVAYGRGGGGGGVPATDTKSMIMPPMYNYSFQYTGEAVQIEDTTAPVYNRIRGMEAGRRLARLIQGQDKSLVDLSRFSATRIQNISFLEENGDYSINLDLWEGRANIFPQYEKWYPVQCDKQGNCNSPTPLTEKDVPPETTLISLANGFLDKYGIDRARFGEPKVDNNWRQGLILRADAPEQSPYVPDVITVVYPISVDGQLITESNGDMYGLRVGVDIRKNKVQSVWNLNNEQYEKSQYDVETDWNKIVAIAERGAMGGWYGAQNKDMKLNLGTPEKIYIPYYNYIPEKQLNQELYIPAFKFPVLNPPADQPYFQKSVVVPLVKEILKNYEVVNPEPRPVEPPVTILESEKKEEANTTTEVQGIRAPDAGEPIDPNKRY